MSSCNLIPGVARYGTVFLADAPRLPQNTSLTRSQRSRHGSASIRRPASRLRISASELLWEVAPCFLQNHATGAHVFGPTIHSRTPEVLLESLQSAANDASVNKYNSH